MSRNKPLTRAYYINISTNLFQIGLEVSEERVRSSRGEDILYPLNYLRRSG